MAEDLLIGFEFIDKADGESATNEAAVRDATNALINETAYRNAFQRQDNDGDGKNGRDDDPGDTFDMTGLSEGFDFMV